MHIADGRHRDGEPGALREAAASPGSAAARRLLGGQLRRQREAAGITPAQAAWHIRGSRAKISRMETGRQKFKERDVRDLLAFYGISDQQAVDGALALARQADAREWWLEFSDLLPGWFEPYIGLEASAARIRCFDLLFVPGLFQTRAYAREVIALGHRTARAAEIDRRVALRLRRQQLLSAARPPHVWSVIDETALRRAVGGPVVMRGQLRRLAEIAVMPAVTLQVLPFQAGGHDAAAAFSLLRFADPGVNDVAYVEQMTGAAYLDKPHATDRYHDTMNRLAARALSPAQTRDLLTAMTSDGSHARQARPDR